MSFTRIVAGRLRLWRNEVFRGGATRGTRPQRSWVFALLGAAMCVFCWAGFRALLAALAAAGAGTAELAQALGLALTAATFTLLAMDLDVAVATLLLDADLELLRRTPLAPRGLLLLKLLDAFPRTIFPIAILALPAAAAFLGWSGSGLAGVFVLPLLLGALWTIALGLGVAAVLPLVALVPPRRAREALGMLGTLALTVVWLVNVLYVPRLAEAGGEPLARLRLVLGAHPAWLALSPGHLAARVLLGLHEHDAQSVVRAAGMLAGLALAAVGLAATSARLFLPRMLEAVAAPISGRRVARRGPRTLRDQPRPFLLATLSRDRRLLMRDWSVFADVIAAAVLWTLLPLVSRLVLEIEAASLARAMLSTLAVGLGYEVGARVVPFERRAAIWMKLAPVPAGRWLLSRLASAACLAFPLVLLAWAVISASLGLPAAEALTVLMFAIAAAGFSLALGVWTGVRFGDPGWTSPRAMLTLPGRLVAAGVMIGQIVVWLGLGALASGTSPLLSGGQIAAVATLVALTLSAWPVVATGRRMSRPDWYR